MKAEDCPEHVERLLKAYLANRSHPNESFLAFTTGKEIDELKAMADTVKA